MRKQPRVDQWIIEWTCAGDGNSQIQRSVSGCQGWRVSTIVGLTRASGLPRYRLILCRHLRLPASPRHSLRISALEAVLPCGQSIGAGRDIDSDPPGSFSGCIQEGRRLDLSRWLFAHGTLTIAAREEHCQVDGTIGCGQTQGSWVRRHRHPSEKILWPLGIRRSAKPLLFCVREISPQCDPR